MPDPPQQTTQLVSSAWLEARQAAKQRRAERADRHAQAVAQVLARSAALIRKRGLAQGAMEDPAGRLDIMGAVRLAAGGFMAHGRQEPAYLRFGAYEAIQEALRAKHQTPDINAWADGVADLERVAGFLEGLAKQLDADLKVPGLCWHGVPCTNYCAECQPSLTRRQIILLNLLASAGQRVSIRDLRDRLGESKEFYGVDALNRCDLEAACSIVAGVCEQLHRRGYVDAHQDAQPLRSKPGRLAGAPARRFSLSNHGHRVMATLQATRSA